MDQYFKFRSGAFATLEARNWDEFKLRVGELMDSSPNGDYRTAYGRFLFRGQSCSSWPLASSFDRRNEDLAPAAAKRKYELILQRFREIAPRYGALGTSVFSERFSNWERLENRDYEALAQHYGLPTRLLDWTTSLYVGAFFAFSKLEQCRTDLVSVWILDIGRTLEHFSSEHLEYITDVYQENVRQLWQMGVFTYNRTPKRSLEELFHQDSGFFDKALQAELPLLVRVDLPQTEATRVLDDLNMMRINSLTLFPGIEGVVRWIDQGGYAFPTAGA